MKDLRPVLEQIAAQFISSVLAAMQAGSLGDLARDLDGVAEAKTARTAASPHPASPRHAKPVRGLAFTARLPSAVAAAPARGWRRHRASAAEVQAQKAAALTAAKTLRTNFSKGDVMRRSGSDVDLGRALSLLVDEGKLIKKGDRRLTRYWVK